MGMIIKFELTVGDYDQILQENLDFVSLNYLSLCYFQFY